MTIKLTTLVAAMTLGVAALGSAADTATRTRVSRLMATPTIAELQRDFALRHIFPDPKPVTTDLPTPLRAVPIINFDFLAGAGG